MARIRTKHGEIIMNKMHNKYWGAFVGYVYILDVGGDFVRLLCMYSRTCKGGFIRWYLPGVSTQSTATAQIIYYCVSSYYARLMTGMGLIETSKVLFSHHFPSLARFPQTILSLIPCYILSSLSNEMKTCFRGKCMQRNSKFLEYSTMQLAVSLHGFVASSASLSSGVHIGNYKNLLPLWDRTTPRVQILVLYVCVRVCCSTCSLHAAESFLRS
jgi:hypothetical protein